MVVERNSRSREQLRDRRRDRIVDTAREMAEAAGWDGVTTRRLADAIGFSQPVLYGHFPQGKSQIMAAVAQLGFVEMATAMRGGTGPESMQAEPEQPGATPEAGGPPDRLLTTIQGYLAFAAGHPATYDAMFSLPTELLFADPESPEELRGAFDVLVRAVGGDPAEVPSPQHFSPFVGTAELLWGTLHGLALLERGGRLRVEDHDARIAGVRSMFGPG